jgi:hypothetical protein
MTTAFNKPSAVSTKHFNEPLFICFVNSYCCRLSCRWWSSVINLSFSYFFNSTFTMAQSFIEYVHGHDNKFISTWDETGKEKKSSLIKVLPK